MKKNKKRFTLFAMILACNLLVLFFLNYQDIADRQMRVANGLYTNWGVELLDGQVDLGAGGRLFKEHTLNGNVRTYVGDSHWQPPLTAGEFRGDAESGRFAVVGERITLESDGIFVFEGREFEVTGTVGAGFPSILDHLVILTGSGAEGLTVERVVVDADSRRELEALVANVGHTPLFSQGELRQFATHLGLGRDLFEEMMILNTFSIAIIFLLIISHTYVTMNQEKNSILHLQGFKRKEIMRENHLSLSAIFGCSVGVVWLVDLVLGQHAFWRNFLLFLGLFLLLQLFYFVMTLLGNLRGRDRYVV